MNQSFYEFIFDQKGNRQYAGLIRIILADPLLPRNIAAGEIYLYLSKSSKYNLYKAEVTELYRLYVISVLPWQGD